MIPKFNTYLRFIGIRTDTAIQRINSIYNSFKVICPDGIIDIFVTDYLKEDGTREYENLWFFSPRFAMEAHSFLTTNYFDIAPLRKSVTRIAMQLKDYNFSKASDKSALLVNLRFSSGVTADLKASKENCDILKSMVLRYFKPNLQY